MCGCIALEESTLVYEGGGVHVFYVKQDGNAYCISPDILGL